MVTQSTLPEEHRIRWRDYWEKKLADIRVQNAPVHVHHQSLFVHVWHKGNLVAAFTPADIPADIDAQLESVFKEIAQ